MPPPHAYEVPAPGPIRRDRHFPTPHERRAAIPQRRVSLAPRFRSCNSKSRTSRSGCAVYRENVRHHARKNQSTRQSSRQHWRGGLGWRLRPPAVPPRYIEDVLACLPHQVRTDWQIAAMPVKKRRQSRNTPRCIKATIASPVRPGPTSPGAFRRARTACGSNRRRCRPDATAPGRSRARRFCRRAARRCSRNAAPSIAGGR